MAILSGTMTLAQYAQQSNDPLIQNIAYSILETDSVLNDIGFVTKPTMRVNGARVIGGLPAMNWRKINASTVVASGTATNFQEQVYIGSNAIDIDRLIMMDNNQVGNPASQQVKMVLKAWSYDINDKFFNNNHSTGNADAFIGIRQRLDDPTSWGTNSACKIDAGGVDLSDSGMSQANANKFIRYIDQMLDEMGAPEGDGCVLYMNRNLRRRAAQAIRLLGVGSGFEMTKDAYERRVYTYRNAVIRTVGLKADQSTEIITNTETSAGANGASTFTSMYGVRYGEEFFNGWQMTPLSVQSIGLRPDEPTIFRTFLEWPIGLYQTHTRALSRTYDIKVA